VKKSSWNAIVDALLVISLVSVAFIGVLMGFFIGRGRVPQAEKYLWGLHRHDWGDLHLIFSLILVGLVLLHFILHIDWIRRMSKRCIGLHWLVTLVILFAIAGGIFYASIALKRAHPGSWNDEEQGLGKGMGRGPRLDEGKGFQRGEGRGRGGARTRPRE